MHTQMKPYIMTVWVWTGGVFCGISCALPKPAFGSITESELSKTAQFAKNQGKFSEIAISAIKEKTVSLTTFYTTRFTYSLYISSKVRSLTDPSASSFFNPSVKPPLENMM